MGWLWGFIDEGYCLCDAAFGRLWGPELSCWDWKELCVVSSTSHPSLPNNQIELVDGFAIPTCSWDLD